MRRKSGHTCPDFRNASHRLPRHGPLLACQRAHHRHIQSHCDVAAGLPEPSPAITVHHPVDHLQSTASTTTNRLPRSAFDSPSHVEVAQHPAGLPGPPQGVVFSALSSCPPPPLGYIPIRGDVVPTHHLVSSSQPYRI